jgi:nitrous oxidase accessory protein NosD
MKNRISFLLGLSSLILIAASSAHAQAKQTWVSGVGDDTNPCSRTAPCLTFAGAISKTAAGGEISALDPGDFGAVVITKSITITGNSNAGILVGGTDAVIVNIMAPVDNVILRGLSINGGGTGLTGILCPAGAKLVIEHCSIYGFTDFAVHAEGNGTISVANSLLTNNGVAVQADPGATVRLSNNEFFDNKTDFGCGGGTLESWGDNKTAESKSGCAPKRISLR